MRSFRRESEAMHDTGEDFISVSMHTVFTAADDQREDLGTTRRRRSLLRKSVACQDATDPQPRRILGYRPWQIEVVQGVGGKGGRHGAHELTTPMPCVCTRGIWSIETVCCSCAPALGLA